ncbi:MAG: hypothetical protein GY696_17530, partial [Gammaproteobacteria bacterium]|nr:hypothetical protein [Gammaproteobacteria bacterium]
SFSGTANDCDISIVVMDEFGDETTVSRIGGSLLIKCDGTLKYYLTRRNITTEGQKAGEWIIPIDRDSSKWNEHKGMFGKDPLVLCECSDGRSSDRAEAPNPILCDPTAVTTTKCKQGEVCVVDPETGGTSCSDAKNSRFDEDAFRNPPLLCGVGDPTMECRSLKNLGGNNPKKWPQVEIQEQTNYDCKSLIDFWEGGLLHRGIITVKETFTLKPKNNKTCQNMTVKCSLKNGNTETPPTPVEGDCENGWTVNATDPEIRKNNRTKLLCKSDADMVKWHFYIYPMGNFSAY